MKNQRDIILAGLSKEFGQVNVLKDINLQMGAGEVHVLLGPSGCGKTTLLRLICGLTQSTRGEIRVLGRSIEDYADTDLASTFGYVIQEGGLYPHMTARDNILLPLRLKRALTSEDSDYLKELTELVHLEEDQLNRHPKELSGGQRQRVALLRGLIRKTPILLLDEPMSALDPLVRAHLQKELKEIFLKFKLTVVLVTHDLREASYLGDQIHLMYEGQVIQSGSFTELKNRPSHGFVQEFIEAQIPQEGL